MIRLPPRSTRTDTPFPYTTPCRSAPPSSAAMAATTSPARWKNSPGTDPGSDIAGRFQLGRRRHREDLVDAAAVHVEHLEAPAVPVDAVDRKSTRLNSSH